MSGDLLARFAEAAEKQLTADAAWMRRKNWSRRTANRMSDERRAHLAAWEAMPARDGAVFLLRALHEPRARRIGR